MHYKAVFNELFTHFDKKTKTEPVIENTKLEEKKSEPVIEKSKKNQVSEKPKEEEKKAPSRKPDNLEVSNKSSKKPIIIGIVVLAAAAIGYFVFASAEKSSGDIENAPTEIVADAETQPQPIEGENVTNLGDFIDFTLPSDDIITIPEKGVEKALLDLVLDNSKSLDESSFWLCLDRIHFEARDPNYKVDSEEQLKNLSLIMSSFPKVELNIGCYTDNIGNPASNLDLSKQRSESMKAGLIKLGIADKRITTEGFGEGFPIAENTTTENQKMNRRISIKIMKK